VALILIASVAFGAGGALMKVSNGFTDPIAGAGVLAAFMIGAVLLTFAVKRQGLANTYVLGLGAEAVISMVIGRYLFGEHVTRLQTAAALLIVAGTAGLRYG
jgi:quaternary ammonium compound-resistance protein SugE